MKTILIALCLMLVSMPAAVRAQESLAAARDLYASASYDDALTLLGRLDAPNVPAADRVAIGQYRAFCLFALGRTVEAEQAIEGVVSLDPLYRPAEADASPRLRSAFASVRQRILPAIVQQEYGRAKAAYDQQNFPVAAVAFGKVMQALGDPDMENTAGRPPLADLRTLAAGFRELSAKAAEPPPVKPEPPPVAPAAVSAPAKSIYDGGDPAAVAPKIVRQDMPLYDRVPAAVAARGGVLEIVIDESGQVVSASIVSSVSPRYDMQLVAAAKKWRYVPATVDGKPVKYRKVFNISVTSGN